MAKNNTRLELTWIGKENRPKLEPRILVEDPGKSYHAAFRVRGDAGKGGSRGCAENAGGVTGKTHQPARKFGKGRAKPKDQGPTLFDGGGA